MKNSTSEETPLKLFAMPDESRPQKENRFKNWFNKIINSFKTNKQLWLLEVKEILALSATMSLLIGLRIFYPVISLIMNGHIDKFHLDAVALSNSIITLTCTGISAGFGYAISTVFSHLMGEESFRKQIGTVAQRAALIFSLYGLFVISIYINIEPILLLLGQNPIIAKLSGYYLLVWLPSSILEMLIMILNRYLLVQNYKLPCIMISLFGLLVNVIAQYILVHVLHLSYLMSPLCHTTSYLLMVITFLLFIWKSSIYIPTWEGFQPLQAFQNWGELLKFSLNTAFATFSVYALMDIELICSGLIGLNIQSEYGVLYNLFLIHLIVTMGFASAVNIRLSTHLGSCDLKLFHIALKTSYIILVCLLAITFIVMLSLHNILPLIFTNSLEIQTASSSDMIYTVLMCCSNLIRATFTNIVRCSLQYLILWITPLVGNIIIGLPLASILAFVARLDVIGILVGCSVAFFIQAVMYFVNIIRTNWEDFTQVNRLFSRSTRLIQTRRGDSETIILSFNKLIKSKYFLLKCGIIILLIVLLIISITLRLTIFRDIPIPKEYIHQVVQNLTRSHNLMHININI